MCSRAGMSDCGRVKQPAVDVRILNMRKDRACMTRAGKIAALFCGICSAIFISSCVSTPKSADKNLNVEVKTARNLLDSWSGQPEILDRAREILVRVLDANPQDFVALRQMARYQLMAGYINDQYVEYKTNVYLVGNYEPGTLQEAEATIRNAIRINPRFAEGYVMLANIQFQQGRLDDADKSLTKADTLGTDDPWLQLNWAKLDVARGEHSAAAKRCQQVLESGTDDIRAKSSAYDFLIDSYTRAGAHDKVIALYGDRIRFEPGNAWVRGNFADYLSETLGRNDEAIMQAREALRIMDYGVGHHILAMALYRKWADMVAQGNQAGAERYFQEARENFPQLNEVMVYGASVPGGEHLTKALITKKGISVDARAGDGSTALLIATNRNRAKVVRFLLDLNASPNIAADSGWTPLLGAADEGNTEIVDMLLAKGADVQATLNGVSAATLAERRGNTALAALLRKRAADIN